MVDANAIKDEDNMASDSATHDDANNDLEVENENIQQKIIQTKLQKVHLIYILTNDGVDDRVGALLTLEV